jgi:hypothetical protein
MKKIFTTCVALACLMQIAKAQSDDFAQLNNKALHLKNGTILSEGDILYIGNPTGCYENCFENIFHEPDEMIPKITYKFTKHVYAPYSGEKVRIKKIKQISRQNEKIWLLTLYYLPQKENLYCYLEKAFDAGEIIVAKTENITVNKETVKSETKQEEPQKYKQSDINTDNSPQTKTETQNKEEKTTGKFSVADEIRKLKALMDEGIITKEEFEKQKAKLLE